EKTADSNAERRAVRTVWLRIPTNCPASFRSRAASESAVSSHAITTRSQKTDSHASFRAIEFLAAKSLREYANCASATFAPMDVPASSNWSETRQDSGFERNCRQNRT